MLARTQGVWCMQVQELAAGTLSGFLKGLPASAEAALRDSCLADVQRLFPPGRAAKNVSPGATQLAEPFMTALWLPSMSVLMTFGSLPLPAGLCVFI